MQPLAVAQQDHADLGFIEVEDHALQAVGEDHKFIELDAGDALDACDAVAHIGDLAELLVDHARLMLVEQLIELDKGLVEKSV